MRTLRLIKGSLVKQFCISFIIQHGRWPGIIKDELKKESPSSPLLIILDSPNINVNLYESNIPLLDWSYLHFVGELVFDYMLDFTELLSDKSISVYRDELEDLYDPSVTGVTPKGTHSTSRRLLVEALDKEVIDTSEICEIIQTRTVPDTWLVVALSSRER